MTARVGASRSEPMAEINTTPLIDVMLVLLVMLVITIPAASHSLPIDLPSCKDICDDLRFDPVRNRLRLDSGDRLLWNGTAIDRPQLAAILAETRRMAIEPELQFAPDAQAGYDATAHALAVIKRSGVTRFGFVGNERFRAFGKAN